MGNIGRKFGSLLDFHRSRSYSRRFLLVTVCLVVASSSSSSSRRIGNGRSMLLGRQALVRDESTKLVPCVMTFVDEYFENPNRISLVLPDAASDVAGLAVRLISELRDKTAVYTLNLGAMSAMETYDDWADAVLFVENASALEGRDAICITNYCARDCRFVIALTSSFADEESFLAEADALIQRVCLRSVFNLAILALTGDAVLHAGSRSIRDDDAYAPAKPMLLDRCERPAARWRRVANGMSDSSLGEMNAAMFENFPYALLINRTDGYARFDGVEGLMVEEIARSIGIKLNREMIEWTNTTNMELELYQRLYNSTKSDLVFGGLLWNNTPSTEYTSCYGMVHVAWIVPISSNVSLRGLIAPFPASVWYAILCALIVGGLVKLFLFRDISFLDIAAFLFGVPVYHQPTRLSSRIKFMAWTLFGFFLAQLYLASLAEQLEHATDMQIESIEEILESGLKLGGTRRLATLFQKRNKAEKEDDVKRTIRENFVVFSQHEYTDHVQELVEGTNTSLALIIVLNLTDIQKMSNLGHAHIVKESMGSYPLALATWRGFSHLNSINFKIQVLLETGLINCWSEMVTLNMSSHRLEGEDGSNLELDDLTPAFFLLLIGYLGGCCLLLLEIIFYPSKIFQ